jgi:CO dehydrogenase maturation factor
VRIAVAGKGGAGKTTITAALARLWAASGTAVCAVDADSNPNLATALGIDRVRADDARALPLSAVSRRLDGGPALTTTVEDLLDRHGLTGPDGIRLVLMGMPAHAEEGCMCSAHATVSALLADLGQQPDTVALIDMEASPEHFGRGTVRHADVLLLVTEPYWRSMETSRRMAVLARELPIGRVAVVANKVRSEEDMTALGEFCASHDLPLIAAIPRSDAVLDADMATRSLVDVADSDDPVIGAIRGLRDRLAVADVPEGINREALA